MTARRISTAARVAPDAVASREAEIATRYLKGQPQAVIAAALGMTESGISRALSRVAARWDREKFAPLRPAPSPAKPKAPRSRAGIGGRPEIWPDCPADLLREYHAVRAIIGSVEAKRQLLALAARDAAERKSR